MLCTPPCHHQKRDPTTEPFLSIFLCKRRNDKGTITRTAADFQRLPISPLTRQHHGGTIVHMSPLYPPPRHSSRLHLGCRITPINPADPQNRRRPFTIGKTTPSRSAATSLATRPVRSHLHATKDQRQWSLNQDTCSTTPKHICLIPFHNAIWIHRMILLLPQSTPLPIGGHIPPEIKRVSIRKRKLRLRQDNTQTRMHK